MPFNEFATHRPTSKAYHKRKVNPWLSLAAVSDVLPASVRFHRWTLGFRRLFWGWRCCIQRSSSRKMRKSSIVSKIRGASGVSVARP